MASSPSTQTKPSAVRQETASWIERALKQERPFDPYLAWADLTDFWASASYDDDREGDSSTTEWVELVLKFPSEWWSKARTSNDPVEQAARQSGASSVGLRRRLDPGQLYLGVAVRVADLGDLVPALDQLGFSCQLSAPRSPRVTPSLDTQSIDLLLSSLRPAAFQEADLRGTLPLNTNAITEHSHREVLVGIVDDGFPVGNSALWLSRTEKKSPLRALWLQAGEHFKKKDDKRRGGALKSQRDRRGIAAVRGFSDVTTGTSSERRQFLYGVELTGMALKHQLAEAAFYEKTNYCMPLRQQRHGFLVSSVLAAQKDPLARFRPDSKATPAPSGIVAVHLPARSVVDTSGGSLANYVIDGIYYCLAHASPGQHVIVNLSYGMHAGPHDGTSTLEGAFKHLLDTYNGKSGKPCLHLVLAAGNSHEAECHVQGKLHSKLNGSNAQSFFFRLAPDGSAPSFIEVYLDKPRANDVRVSLTPPGLDKPAISSRQGGMAVYNAKEWSRDKKVLSAAIVFPNVPTQSAKQSLALCAMAPTRVADLKDELGRPANMRAADGVWQLTIENLGDQVVDFHAWIERNDVAPGRRLGGRQARFLPVDTKPVPECTLSGIATFHHERAHIVGAGFIGSQSVSDYSAAGPALWVEQRVEGPSVVVPIDTSRAVSGLRCEGALRGVGLHASGTSIAAAAYTRLLAARLASGADATSDEALVQLPAAFAATPPPIETLGSKDHAAAFLRGEYRRVLL
jgi:hypothetical protein